MNNSYCLYLSLFALFSSTVCAQPAIEHCEEIVYYAKTLPQQNEVLLCQQAGSLQLHYGGMHAISLIPLAKTSTRHATWWRGTNNKDMFSAGLTFIEHHVRYTFYTLQSEEGSYAGLVITQGGYPTKWIIFDPQSVLHVIDNHLTHFGLKEYRPFPHHP